MEASAGLVAGSHNRNELVVIRRDRDGESGVSSNKFNLCKKKKKKLVHVIVKFLLLVAAKAVAAFKWTDMPDMRRRCGIN